MRWDEFAAACPDLSSLGEERLRGRELCLVGTLRRNGWPRISPVEPDGGVICREETPGYWRWWDLSAHR